jgi:hypothetical protein
MRVHHTTREQPHGIKEKCVQQHIQYGEFGSHRIVTCRTIAKQRPRYTHATIEQVLREVSTMWVRMYPVLSNDSISTFQRIRNNREHRLWSNLRLYNEKPTIIDSSV